MKDTERARRVPFGELPWADDAPGIRAREVDVGGARWATVEYEFDDESEPLRASEGEAFFLPPATLGAGAHRGRNRSGGPTRLFLIDDAREG